MAVSDEQLRQIRRYLNPGEQIVWAGQPRPGRALRSAFRLWLFAVPWTAFALFWTAMAWGMTRSAGDVSGVGSFFPYFGIPFVLVGLAMLASPFWAWRRAQKTLYAVTTQRAIVGQMAGGGFTLDGFRPDELTDLTLTVRSDGSGTIDLRSETRRAVEATQRRNASFVGGSGGTFADIPEVEKVFDLLRQLARAAPPETPPLLDADPYAAAYGSTFSSDFDRDARRHSPGWKTPGG